MGHLSDAAAIGGIAIGTMLFDLLYWNFGFLRVGTSGLTAQAFGAGDRAECRKILTQSLSIALMAALAIWAIQWFFVTAVLAIVPCSDTVAEVARRYFFVRIWAAPATLSLFTMKGWFIGMQDTRSPMAVDILVNIVNMIASFALAVYTPLGIVGVAWGTLIAQYTGLALAGGIMLTRYREITLSRYREWKELMRWSEMRRMMRLNGNLFIRSLCFMVIYVGYTSLAGKYGDTELAVSSILMKFFMFFSFFVDGFAYAGEALVGKEFGLIAKRSNSETVRVIPGSGLTSIVKSLFNWSIGVGLLFTVIYAIWGKELLGAMTTDTTVLHASGKYIGWLIAMPLISTLAFMWDGIYVGATAGVQIRNAMIWAAIGFVVGYLATFRFVGPQALYIGYFAHLVARTVYLSVKWKDICI